MDRIRVGIVGLGANTRDRHVPGLRACDGVEIAAVCNRRPESTRQAAEQFEIPKTYASWQQLVADPDLDAVVVGTWPYLHCAVTLAALASGKHVMTEARMARNFAEALRMRDAARKHPDLVTQIVPSPFGLRGHQLVVDMLEAGYLGELREVAVLGTNGSLCDASTPIHWRQDASLSGLNMLILGILHETLIRWVPDPVSVQASTHIFTPQRPDPVTGEPRRVGTPDSAHVLTELPNGARGLYHLSGVMHHGPTPQIHLYGTAGTIKYLLAPQDQLLAARHDEAKLQEVEIPSEKAGGWRVEEEFVGAIRGQEQIERTDFETGVRYMRFTDAVARAAASGARQSI